MNIFSQYLHFRFSLIFLLSLVNFLFTFSFSQQDESWKLYDDSNVVRVDITIDPDTLAWMYEEDNVESDIEHYAVFHFQNIWINETVDSIGFRLRGNTSRHSAKKSFKVAFNTFISGREFYGVDKLNLNGEHNDPSIIRSKLCFDHFKSIGLTASRANHAEVYINGQYYGLYVSVEHVDDEFLWKNFNDDSGNLWKCLYPADLNFLGSDPTIYKNLIDNGRPVYELKTNEEVGDFSKLAHFIDVLNNTPSVSLLDSLESIIRIPQVLQYFAMNVLMGSWDDYWSLMNNYYLYYEPADDIFQLIPYDYDNSYGIDWFNIDWTTANPYNFPKVVNGYRPLAERLMQNSQYRNLYTHFLQFYKANVYALPLWENHIDSIKQLITGSAVADTFRTMDYGFDVNDFNNSYSATGYNNQHVKYGLKQFVNLRNSALVSQLSYMSAKPIVYNIHFEPKYPGPDDSIKVTVSAFDNDGLAEVSIYFKETGSSTTDIHTMSFTPITSTKKVEESDRFIGFIPPLGENGSGEFYIYVKDNQNQFQFYPRKAPIFIATPREATDNLFINEFMADNDNVNPDPSGEYDDWIEIYNASTGPILLTGKYLTDKNDNLIKWQFTQPNLYINPNEYLLVWCDEQETQPGIHTNFKLSAGGEFIAIVEDDGITVIDSLSFGSQTTDVSFGRYPDGSNNWIFFQSPTPGASNIITSVEDEFVPNEFSLSAYPNPFNPSTAIRYTIPNVTLSEVEGSRVQLIIYDILGNEVANLLNEDKPAGTYEIAWNGENNAGLKVSSGIYFIQIQADQQFKNLKLMLLK